MTMYEYKIKGKKFHGTIIIEDNANANHIAQAINEAIGENLATPNNVVLSNPMRLHAMATYEDAYFGSYTGMSWID